MEITVIASSSSGNAYLVKEGETEILIECGIQFKKLQKALDFRVTSLSGVLVSHSHKDHSKCISDLLGAGCDVYTSKETMQELSIEHYCHHLLVPGEWIIIGNLRVLPISMDHDVPCVGFYILNNADEALLFATDTGHITWGHVRIDHLMIECNYEDALLESDESCFIKDRISRTHMSLSKVIRFLQAANLEHTREIIIMHLSDSHSDEAMFKRVIEERTGRPVTVAKK